MHNGSATEETALPERNLRKSWKYPRISARPGFLFFFTRTGPVSRHAVAILRPTCCPSAADFQKGNTSMIKSRTTLLCAGLLAMSAATGAFAQAPAAESPAVAQPPAAAPATAAPAPAAAPAARHHRGAKAPGKAKAKAREHAPRDRAAFFERMQQRHAQHMAELKNKLKITAAQESAWTSFAEAHQVPPAPPAGARMNRDEFAKLTTPQRLDLMEKRRAERDAMMSKHIEATRALYAALTPEQQAAFDAESPRGFGPGGPGPRGPGERKARGQRR
jgi:hypothetical protein